MKPQGIFQKIHGVGWNYNSLFKVGLRISHQRDDCNQEVSIYILNRLYIVKDISSKCGHFQFMQSRWRANKDMVTTTSERMQRRGILQFLYYFYVFRVFIFLYFYFLRRKGGHRNSLEEALYPLPDVTLSFKNHSQIIAAAWKKSRKGEFNDLQHIVGWGHVPKKGWDHHQDFRGNGWDKAQQFKEYI